MKIFNGVNVRGFPISFGWWGAYSIVVRNYRYHRNVSPIFLFNPFSKILIRVDN